MFDKHTKNILPPARDVIAAFVARLAHVLRQNQAGPGA